MSDPVIGSAQALMSTGDSAGANRLIARHHQRRPISVTVWRALLPLEPVTRWSISNGIYTPAFSQWEPAVSGIDNPPSYVRMWRELFAARQSERPGVCRDRIHSARAVIASAEDAVVLAFAALIDHSADLAVEIAADAARFREPVPDLALVARAFALARQYRIDESVAAFLSIQDPELRRDAILTEGFDALNECDATRCQRLTTALRPHISDVAVDLNLSSIGALSASFAIGASQRLISQSGATLGGVYRQAYAPGTRMDTMPPHPTPCTPLRLGLLSDSLVSNVGLVGLDQLDPTEVEIYGYCQRLPPGIQHGLRHLGFLTRIRGFNGLPWQTAAAMIAEDQLDVLLFYGNFGFPERLEVLLQRLAKRVIAFSNTFGSTGGIGIDALVFAEQLVDPGDQEEISEPILTSRFPLKIFDSHDGHLIEPVSRSHDAPLTIGIVASEYKLNQSWISALAEVLRAVPTATALIEVLSVLEGSTKAVRAMFARANLPEQQLRLRFVQQRTPLRARLEQFSLVFDSSPFTGNLTVLQALSAGVPVVTVRGETIPSRHAAGLLAAIGETSLITTSLADQVARTVELLRNPDELAAIRQRLPGLVRASPMVDPKALGQELLRVVRASLDLPVATGA